MLTARLTAALVLLSASLAACVPDRPARAATGPIRSVAMAAVAADDATQPHPAMLRYPDVSATHIVFVFADDLWIVPREGGQATPLASPSGMELFPKFSADGRTIAFSGNYDGNQDLYTIPTAGGTAHRVTHHPAREMLCGWTPSGELLYYGNGFAGLRRQTQLFTVGSEGGLPSKLPPPYGANGAISSDGQWLAYTPHSRDSRTWKRYRGGMATDIWLFNLNNNTSKKITDWEGTDSLPMWHGQTVYYLSDGGSNHRLNIWSFNTATSKRAQVTQFADYDVKWPSMGPGASGQGEIVFQNGAGLYLLDLSTGEAATVSVSIPGDRPTIRQRTVDAGKSISGWDISATGKRGVVEARGDIWTIPAKNGSPRNLTSTDGVADRDPSWSPDGQWIAYFSDATGEYELYITQSDGKGETKQLTSDKKVFRSNPTWSPDSKHITYSDKTGISYLYTLETGATKIIDTDPSAGILRMSWSHDSGWVAYAKSGANQLGSIWMYQLETGAKHQVTSGMFNDTWPTFDRKGDYLFFASNREFSSPMYEDIGQSFIYGNSDVLVAVPLRDEVEWPWAPSSDEESWGDDEDDDEDAKDGDDDKKEKDSDDAKDKDDSKASDDDADGDDKADDDDDDKDNDEDKDKKKDKDEIKPLEMTIEGFERRARLLPVKRGGFSRLAVTHEDMLVYVRGGSRGSNTKPAIKIFEMDGEKNEKKEEKDVVKDARLFVMSADGKKLLVLKDGKAAIVKAAADQKLDKPLSTKNLTAHINPRDEWKQIFTDAWRIHRDYFYDPNMHGVDWDAVRERYGAMLNDCVSRRDVTFVIGEMISELNVGHAYVRGAGDVKNGPRVSVGMLGVDFVLDQGAYKIAKIFEGAAWDLDARGPLSRSGVDVKEGDYLLAINGVSLDASKDPWAGLTGLADKIVTLTVSDKPVADDDAREVVIETLSSESNLRYRSWIESNRKYVEEKTDGRVGYIYVPDTGVNGQNNLVRQFFGQIDKEALIIDERWNGGGQIPNRFIELLNRPLSNYWALRDGRDWTWPPDANHGPKCMLINGLAGSGGDCFPYYFRQSKLGKLIGMRTWGGLVGMSGNPRFIDGGSTSVPRFAFYETDGTWGVEGHGVDPDIEVVDDPALMVNGGDPQLDVAIKQMLAELRQNPRTKPARPAYPDRSGMGIREEDK